MKILSVICTSPGKWNSSGIATRKTDLDKKKNNALILLYGDTTLIFTNKQQFPGIIVVLI